MHVNLAILGYRGVDGRRYSVRVILKEKCIKSVLKEKRVSDR